MSPRHLEFDVEEALAKALELFREKGYDATSLNDLCHGMGISRQSLYNTFGDKKALFLAALDRFRETRCEQVLAGLVRPDASLRDITDYFYEAADNLTADYGRKTCLVVNTVMDPALDDGEVDKRVKSHLDSIESAFFKALTGARSKGELGAKVDTRSLAKFLTGCALGMTVTARSGASREHMREMVGVIISLIS